MVMMVLALQATLGRAFLFIFIVFDDFRLRSHKKLQKETLGTARKSGAEGESLKLLSDFYSIFPSKVMSFRILESICGVMQRKEEIAFRGRCSTIPGQRCNSSS